MNESKFYVIDFSNHGGLVMPILLDITYADSTTEHLYIPAEIWRRNTKKVSKLLIRDKEITEIALDANWQTADVNINNNYWPARPIQSRFDLYKAKKKDMMRDYNKKLKDISDENIEDEKEEDQ